MLKNTLFLVFLAASLASAEQNKPSKDAAPAPQAQPPKTAQPAKAAKAVAVEAVAAKAVAAKAVAIAAEPAATAEPDAAETPQPANDALENARAQQERLAILNGLASEKQKHETLELRSTIAKLKLEKELLTERLALASAQEKSTHADAITKFNAEKEELTRQTTLAKLKAEKLSNELKATQTAASLKTTALLAEISEIETSNKRANYANAEPQYLENPLKEDGTLVISDRRIAFNGPVTSKLADRVTERINYFNNKDPKLPIFIVIDDSPGGSVMAGYRMLKSMEGSTAPVYVVVKSFAASMAATITTLAERSFVYPNAVILHHQISQSFAFSSMNLTEQKENVNDLKKWWARLADPIAQKMGITSDEFIEMMYKKTVSGDWTEFGDDAVKLKWADHVVSRIHETSLLKNPDAKKPAATAKTRASDNGLTPAVDENGNPYMILPRRNPKDVYMMHNPDGYYRFK